MGDGESSSSAQMAAAWSTLSRHPHLDASARAHIALLDLVMERVCERMLSLAPSEARSSDEEAETAAAAVNQALHRIGSSFCAAGERVVDLCLQQALAAESTVDTTSSRSSSTPAAVSAHSRSHGSASSVGTASDADDGEQAEGQPPARKKSKDASGSPKGVTQLDPSEPDCDSIAALPAAGAAVADRKRVASPPGSARRSAGGRVKKEAASDEEGGEDEYQPRRKRKSRAKTKRPDDVSGKSSESRAANPEKQTGLLLSLLVAHLAAASLCFPAAICSDFSSIHPVCVVASPSRSLTPPSPFFAAGCRSIWTIPIRMRRSKFRWLMPRDSPTSRCSTGQPTHGGGILSSLAACREVHSFALLDHLG
jgi:hypothetical protein